VRSFPEKASGLPDSNAKGFHMFQSQMTERNSPRTYSLSVPTRLSEVKTIVIACSETDALPKTRELQLMEPLAYLTIPGGIAFFENEDNSDIVQFLESLLLSAQQVEFIAICMHTKCTHSDAYKISTGDSESNTTSIEYESILAKQIAVKQQLFRFKQLTRENKLLARRNVAVSGWLYETEINWLSFYDYETDQFLPLSVKPELYKDQ